MYKRQVQRLKLMHDMFNMDGASKFHFDWKDLVKSGLSVKDAIAPTAFAFKNSRTFQMGGIYCAVSFLSITASDISDQLLKDFLDMDSSQIVTMHIQSVDQNKAIKTDVYKRQVQDRPAQCTAVFLLHRVCTGQTLF